MIIHTSDLHLGGLRAFPGSFARDLSLLQQLENLKASRLFIVGDVFDQGKPELPILNAFLRFASSLQIPTDIVVGNHDYSSRDLTYHALKTIAEIPHLFPHVRVHDQVEERGKMVFVPARRPFPETSLEGKVILYHGEVKGARMSPQYQSPLGISPSRLEGVLYGALGDFHVKQQVAPRAYYCGTPLAHRFGEENNGFLGIEGEKIHTIPVDAPRLITVTSEADLAQCKGNIIRIVSENGEELARAAHQAGALFVRCATPLPMKVQASLDDDFNIRDVLASYVESLNIERKMEVRDYCLQILEKAQCMTSQAY